MGGGGRDGEMERGREEGRKEEIEMESGRERDRWREGVREKEWS